MSQSGLHTPIRFKIYFFIRDYNIFLDELPINANVSVVALKSCPLPFDKLQKAAYQILSEALAGAERTEHLIDTANKTKLTPTQLLTGQLSKSQEDLSKSQRKRKILGKALKKQGIDPKLLDSSFSSTTSRDTTPASTPKRGPRPCNLELSPLLAPIDESPACSVCPSISS
jgi:hypothetical protein